MSSEEQGLLTEISRKLDVLIALTAADGKDADAQIDLLTSLGFGPSFIAPIIGLAPNAITKRISRRKEGGKKRRRKPDTD
jgi:hypothetical protein